MGDFNRRVRRVTRNLLQRGLVHIIASDTHFPQGPRSPRMAHGVEAAARIVGHDRALAMVKDTPRAILEDLPVEVEPPSASAPTRGWWRLGRS